MKNKQIKYILIALLAGVTGFVVYSQETTERFQTLKSRAAVRALKLWQQTHPAVTQPVSEQVKKSKEANERLSQTLGLSHQEVLQATLDSLSLRKQDQEQFKSLINELITKEKEHPNDFVFYHGMNKNIMIVLDMVKRLYTLSSGREVKAFEFLRVPTALAQNLSPEQFIEKYKLKLKGKFDHIQTIRGQLLSTNISISGHIDHGESSFAYFVASRSQSMQLRNGFDDIVNFIFKDSTASKHYVEVVKELMFLKLAKIQQILEVNNYGLLLQVFIPKELVDKSVYISEAFGIPIAGEYRFKASRFLETFKRNPVLLKENLQTLQARIVLNKDLFSRPGIVKIYRYHLMPQEAYNNWYLPSVKDITDELLLIRLEQPSIENVTISLIPFMSDIASSGEGDRVIELLGSLIERGQGISQITELATELVKNLDSGIQHLVGKDLFKALIEKDRGIKEVIHVATELVKSSDFNSRYSGQDLFKALIEKDRGIKEAIDVASESVKNSDSGIRYSGQDLFKQLIEKDRGIKEVIHVATELVKSSDSGIRSSGRDLFKELIKKEHGIKEAIDVASESVKNSDSGIRDSGVDLFKELIKKEHGIKEAIHVASESVKNSDLHIQDSGVNLFKELVDLFKELIKNGHRIKEAIHVASELVKSSDINLQENGLSLFIILVEHGHVLPEIIQIAVELNKKGAEMHIIGLREKTLILFNKLVDQGQGILQAARAANWALKSRDSRIRELGEQLMNKIREHKRKTGGAKL